MRLVKDGKLTPYANGEIKKGKIHFIVKHGVLRFGLLYFLISYLEGLCFGFDESGSLVRWFTKEVFTCLMAGSIFGWVMFYGLEKRDRQS